MKKFLIKVNGNSYEVEVEEIGTGAAPAVKAAPAPAAAPAAAPAPAPAPKSAPAPASVEGAEEIKAPMPGTILDIKVSAGQQVKAGDVVCILEAMKMENEILAPRDGKVVSVSVSQGASVNSGDVLAQIA